MLEIAHFGDRLRDLLATRHPSGGGPAWLAKASGAERSTISRILKDGRIPSRETLDLIAPALGLSVEQLVDGTDAAMKARSGPEFVPQEHHAEAIAKMLEFERKANEAEDRARQQARTAGEETERRRRAEEHAARLERVNAAVGDELRTARREITHLEHRIHRRTEALEKAVKELNELRERVAELRSLVEEGKNAGRLTAILAAVAAFTGVVTVATYLGRDDDDGDGDDADEEGATE